MHPHVVCYVDIYKSYFIGLFGVSAQEAATYCRDQWEVELDFHGSEGRSHFIRQGNVIINIVYMETLAFTPRYLALLSHEVLHACLQVLGEIGQGVDPKDHEHLTYFQQHVFEKLLERHQERVDRIESEIQKRKKKRKR